MNHIKNSLPIKGASVVPNNSIFKAPKISSCPFVFFYVCVGGGGHDKDLGEISYQRNTHVHMCWSFSQLGRLDKEIF